MIFKIPLSSPAELMATLMHIKSQHPSAKVVIDVLEDNFSYCTDALAYNDIFESFSPTGKNPLDIEINLKSYVTQFFLIFAAAIPREKVFIGERVYMRWIEFNDFLWGTESEQEDMVVYYELVNKSLEAILEQRYDMDIEEMKGLICDEALWQEDDIQSLMEARDLSESEADKVLPNKMDIKPEPVIPFNCGFRNDGCGRVVRALDVLRQAGHKEAAIIINSPGGSVLALETMLAAKERFGMNIKIICVGMAASAGAVFLSSGAKGQRIATRNSVIMIHQFRGGGTVKSLELGKLLADKMNTELSKNANIPRSEIEAMLKRDYYMSAEEAMKFGFIDAILG